MVVDDDAFCMFALMNYFDKVYGKHVEQFQCPFEALNRAKEKEFKMIITDMNMPGMYGDKLAFEIKKLHPRTFIVLATAETMSGDPPQGVDKVVSKPLNKNKLKQLINMIN